MKIFAIDTSAKAVSAAAVEFDREEYTVLGELNLNNGLQHSQTLVPAVQSLLDVVSMKPGDFDALAVTSGPGSFTGLRIGIATVKGISDASGVKCIGISSLLALAYNVQFFEGIACPVMDARCSQVYNALFSFGTGGVTRLCDDRAVSISDLGNELLQREGKIMLTGDGAALVYRELSDVVGDRLSIAPCEFRTARAVNVAKAAYAGGSFTDSEKLLPYYLRQPQAVREQNKNN